MPRLGNAKEDKAFQDSKFRVVRQLLNNSHAKQLVGRGKSNGSCKVRREGRQQLVRQRRRSDNRTTGQLSSEPQCNDHGQASKDLHPLQTVGEVERGLKKKPALLQSGKLGWRSRGYRGVVDAAEKEGRLMVWRARVTRQGLKGGRERGLLGASKASQSGPSW